MTSWPPLERSDKGAFARGRRDVHVALQLVAAAAASYAKPLSDDGHTATTWTSSRAFRSVAIGATTTPSQAVHVELEAVPLRLTVGGVALSLEEQTFKGALEWLRARLVERGFDGTKLAPPRHEGFALPPEGQVFDAKLGEARESLARYYDASDALLRAVAEGSPPPRVWPHHFDIATRITLPDAKDASIGLGMSPGDDSYDEPYWYASPWPVPPATDTLPRLAPTSTWHTRDWFGAVLLASTLPDDPPAQRATLRDFFDAAIKASRTLISRIPAR